MGPEKEKTKRTPVCFVLLLLARNSKSTHAMQYRDEAGRLNGMMLKKGGGRSREGENLVQSQLHRRNWQRRWFVLEVEAGELHYYRNESLSSYKGCVRLTYNSSIKIPDTVHLRGRHRPAQHESLNYFEIHDSVDLVGRPRRKPFALRAPSGEELVQWLRSLHGCLTMLREEEERSSLVGMMRRRRSLSDYSREYSSSSSEDDDSDDGEVTQQQETVFPPLAELPADTSSGSFRLDELRDALCSQSDDLDAHPEPLPPPSSPPEAPQPSSATTPVLRGDEGSFSSSNPFSPASSSTKTTPRTTSKRRPPPPPPKGPPPSPDNEAPAGLSWAVDRTFAQRTPRKKSLSKRADAVDALVLASASENADAIAVSIEHAVEEAGVDRTDPIVVAAKEKLEKLDQPGNSRSDRRSQLEAALDSAVDRETLGNAIFDAVAFGMSQDSPQVMRAQARLCRIVSNVPLVDDDDEAEDRDVDRIAIPNNITRLFVC